MDKFSQSDIILKKIYATMSSEQKFAYLYTIMAFLSFADNESDDENETFEENSLIFMQMAILLDDTLKLIGMSQDDMNSAVSFFEDKILGPVDYLKEVDPLVLDSLLFVCSCIVESKKTEYKGHNIKNLAKEFLYDYFGRLNYSKEKVNTTINRIMSFYPNN